jgi:hypothetical protein
LAGALLRLQVIFYYRNNKEDSMAPLRYTFIQPISSHQYLGKQFYYQDKHLRQDIDKLGSFNAEVVECTDLQLFYEEIESISSFENSAIILGVPKGIAPGEPFEIRPESWLTDRLGKVDRKDLVGIHEIDGGKVIGRFKENFEPSRIVLLDYDPDEHTPPENVYDTDEAYIDGLRTIFEDFAHTGFVVTSSSSAGLLSPNGALLKGDSPKRHAFFTVDDPSDIHRFREAFMFHSMKCDMSWKFVNKGGNVLLRYIFDANTFSPERIVYEGKPQLNDGIAQYRDAPRYISGGSLDTMRLPSPTEQQIINVHRKMGIGSRRVLDRTTGKIRSTYSLSTNGEHRPILKNTTQFVRAEAPGTVLTIKDFLASGDDKWRVISEFRCDLSEAPNKSSVSEVLLRSSSGDSCVLYEHDGGITYCFDPKRRIRDHLHSQIFKDRETPQSTCSTGNGSAAHANTPASIPPKSLKPGSVHLLFGRPGQGKSHQAIKLAKQGRLIIFASASNEQSEEQYANCRHTHKELLVSRAYKLQRDYGVEIALQSSGDPFEAPEADEVATCRRLIHAGQAKNMEHALEIWKSLSTGDSAPPPQGGTILFTTFERARVWASSGYFEIRKDTPYNKAQCIRRAVLFVDDVERESISDYRRITKNVRKWMNMTRSENGQQFETVPTKRGNEYLVRQESQAVLKGFENMSTVFSTVEWRAKMMLEILYPDQLKIHDMSPEDNAKDNRTDLYLLGTELVGSKYHALFHLLTELWRRQGTDWLWVGDGVQADENHYTVRGKNAYREHDTIIKVSQPHPNVSDKCMLDIGLEGGNQNVAVAYTMLDQLNQAVGRNQGERYCGKRCIVLVDPGKLKLLDEFTGYRAKMVSKVDDINLTDIADADVRYIVNTLKRPTIACKNGLTEGLPPWLRSHEDKNWKTKIEEAMKHYDSETSKARETRRDRGETMSSEIIQDALQGSNWRAIERKRNLGRKLDKEEKEFLKQCLHAIRLTLEAKRDIGNKYPTLRVFEQKKNWCRVIADPEIRKALRGVLRSKIIQ